MSVIFLDHMRRMHSIGQSAACCDLRGTSALRHAAALCKNDWTDRDPVRLETLAGTCKTHCMRWAPRSRYGEGRASAEKVYLLLSTGTLHSVDAAFAKLLWSLVSVDMRYINSRFTYLLTYLVLFIAGHFTIRYTRCYFNVRSKANMSQLNLPHGNDN